MKTVLKIIAATLSTATGAFAQEETICMQAAEMETALIDWYGETPVFEEEENKILWASGIGGTWTVVTYEPDGTSCTLAHGDNWAPDMNKELLFAQLSPEKG